jgi:ABC-type branched-subunit amino acid transport system ATPase component
LETKTIKLTNKDFDKVLKLLKECQFALDAEIEAVRERPSQDTVDSGTYKPRKATDEHDYVFKSTNVGMRFSEKIKARVGDKGFDVSFVDASEDEITLRFPEHLGPKLHTVDLEWENDFVLRRMQDQLRLIESREDDEQFLRIAQLFFHKSPGNDKEERTDYARQLYEVGDVDYEHDGNRNSSQCESIQKAVYNPVSFVWGPPGTGKTTTLGYIVANLMLQGKKVLFLSNTNRAVDVGMLSVMESLHAIGKSNLIPEITRFGDIALSSEALDRIHHEKLADVRRTKLRQKAAQLQELMAQFRKLQDEGESIEMDGGTIPLELGQQLDAAIAMIRKQGGIRKIEELTEGLQNQLQGADFFELINKKVVGTTLARVCTSEMFYELEFDAVVVDESSMASLPYLVIMAARCRHNMIVAGDPMQLPPISMTSNEDARKLLEQDIFAYASGANEPNDLFQWHDFNPLATSFFDVQYRLNADLADIISDVFYEGRLKSLDMADKTPSRKSYEVIDTSAMNPSLDKKKKDYGFSPKNDQHLKVVEDLVTKLVMRDLIPMEQIGIIVPFRSVVWDVRLALKKKGFSDVEVGTIHTYQGREKKVIIFDTVMSGEVRNGRVTHFSVRPFDEQKNGLSVHRLLNVAFSRAKDRLYVIADMGHIRIVYGKKFLGKLIDRLMIN